ncbi:hypothetical protein [Streptomyces sp. NPDC048357]|uniref:hypothetical protein n=1 Tax=Streptomyces sp. NPDC048357 TaxID=3154719 RepID=UPI00341823AE
MGRSYGGTGAGSDEELFVRYAQIAALSPMMPFTWPADDGRSYEGPATVRIDAPPARLPYLRRTDAPRG